MIGAVKTDVGLCGAERGMTFDQETYMNAKPDACAFAGDRTRLTEADIMAMVASTQEGNAV
jgi:hypothetical protein